MTKVIFWEKVPKFDTNKRITTFVKIPVSAELVGDSESICGWCRELEVRHKRKRRRHPFQKPIGGQTLEVTYSNEQTHTRHNVQKGKSANCWTEKE